MSSFHNRLRRDGSYFWFNKVVGRVKRTGTKQDAGWVFTSINKKKYGQPITANTRTDLLYLVRRRLKEASGAPTANAPTTS